MAYAWSRDPGGAPRRGYPAERLRACIRFAVLAPSHHNAQPWWFDIVGPEVCVSADGRRALPAADPAGREAVLACGAAMENLRLAARHFGHATSVEVLATRPYGAIARLRLEEPRPPDGAEEPLFHAIPRRRTNRFGFSERSPPPGLVTRLARDAADGGASLRVVEESARRAVAEIIGAADRELWARPRFRAELAAWTRPAVGARDGVPAWARGLSGAASLLERFRLHLSPRAAPEDRRDRQQALHTPSLLLLTTSGDAPRDWAQAGMAFERVLLRAAAHGLSASYFSAAIALEPFRDRLREVVGETGFPQVLFRIGYGREVPSTPRRPVDAVLRTYRPRPAPAGALAQLGAHP